MKKIKINEIEFEIIDDYKNGFEKEAFEQKYTDYFDNYDYVIGDWSYGKLRLKGLCDKGNKIFNKINDYNNVSVYLKEECAYDCRYFIAKKIKNLDK